MLEVKPNGVKAWRYRFEPERQGVHVRRRRVRDRPHWRNARGGRSPPCRPVLHPGRSPRGARQGPGTEVKQGINPAHARQLNKIRAQQDANNTFEVVAREWVAMRDWEETTKARRLDTLTRVVFPKIERWPVKQITPAHVLDVLKTAHGKNGPSVADEVKRTMSSVFDLAVSTLRADTDPVQPVRKALPANKTQHKRPPWNWKRSDGSSGTWTGTADATKHAAPSC